MVQPEFWLGILWDIVATVAACIAGIFSWSIRGRLHRFDSDLAALRKRLDDGQGKCRERSCRSFEALFLGFFCSLFARYLYDIIRVLQFPNLCHNPIKVKNDYLG